ncbi:universal stress protein [Streptomyces sp. WAC 01529]|uniref:universal stress protein n=1 Tax=Streptomyces sp. WAC 01529 TaxID=2203205 RepID=UPI001F0BB801|nr:universal stress protein [Streptomyces sp. WAC 01529]
MAGTESGRGPVGGRGRVIVGVSGSLASLAALRVAAEEARRGHRVLVAVIAWEPPEGEKLYLRHPDREWAGHWQAEARARLDRAFDEVFGGAPPGVDSERRVIRARPASALSGLATRPDDLLVLGTRPGRRRPPRTHRQARSRTTCPILTVPSPSIPKGLRRALRRMRVEDFGLVGE